MIRKIFTFKKLKINRPNPIEAVENHIDDEGSEKKQLLDKKYLFPALLILFLVVIVLSNLSLIPLTGYKKSIEKQFKNAGFDVNIRGGINLNLFSLRYEVKDITIYKKDDSSISKKCRSSIEGSVPTAYISFLTGRVTLIDSHFIISTNNNSGELFNFIKHQNTKQNISLTIQNSQINLELCDIMGYAGSNEIVDNTVSNKPTTKQLLVSQTKTDTQSQNNTTSYSVNLMTIKQMEIDTSIKSKEMNGLLYINKTEVNLRFKQTKTIAQFGISSDYLTADLYADYTKPNSNGVIGYYKVNSDNIGKFITLLRGDSGDFIASIFNKTSVNIQSDISMDNNSIKSHAKVITSYGNGEINTSKETDKPTKIIINFDGITTDHYEPIINQKESYSFITIGDFLLQQLFNINYDLDLSIKKITNDTMSISDILFGYSILNGKFTANNLSSTILNNDTPSGNIILFPSDTTQAQSDDKASHLKIKITGQNFVNLLYLSQNIILGKTGVFDIKNSRLQQISYDGYVDFMFGLGSDSGISDFNITLPNNQKIYGSYLNKQPSDGNDYLFSSHNMSIWLEAINLDDILTNKAQQNILQYCAQIRGVNNSDTIMSDIGLLKNVISYTNYSPPSNMIINLNNVIINKQSTTGNLKFKTENNVIELSTNIENSSIFTGSTYFLIDVRKVIPIMQFKATLINLNIREFDNFLYGIYGVSQPQDVNVFSYLKRGILLPNLTNINSDISFEAKNITGNVFNSKNFTAYIKGSGNTFIIDRIGGDMDNGSFFISGDMKSKKSFDCSLSFKFMDLDLDYLLASFINKSKVASGKILIDGNIVATGNNIYDIIFSSRGIMAVKINNMYWNSLDLVTLSKQLVNSVKHGSIDIDKTLETGSKMFFQNTSGDFIIENGIIATGGIAAKAGGVSSVLKLSVDLLSSQLRSFEGNFLILAKDPRPNKDYISIPIALKAVGQFNNITSQLYVDRIQEYIRTMNKMELAKGIE